MSLCIWTCYGYCDYGFCYGSGETALDYTGPCPVNVILSFGLILTQCNLTRLQLCLSYMIYTDEYYRNSI